MSLETKVAKLFYVGCVTVFLTSLGCWALLAHQDVSLPNGRTAGQAIADEQFVGHAAQCGVAEVRLAQMAQERGSNEAVKGFAQRMVAQHSRANDELKLLAAKASISFPAEVSAKDQNAYDRLSKLSGVEFDRAYAKEMVKDHLADVADFQREINGGRKEGVKTFAALALPMLREHLSEAREMLKMVSRNSTSTKRHRRGVQAGR